MMHRVTDCAQKQQCTELSPRGLETIIRIVSRASMAVFTLGHASKWTLLRPPAYPVVIGQGRQSSYSRTDGVHVRHLWGGRLAAQERSKLVHQTIRVPRVLTSDWGRERVGVGWG
ncbi:hypothetical protein RRG08_059050 [Elysia crispata]|uniref:Uncharacterized protein n=1 Tax=Elysia crispata TaxID=231223 RepID=A0AAE0ZDV3_9GAST|nr:hypothetical protein RRG08_059050 [Elysia crispata]